MQNVGPLYGSAGRSPCCETTNQVCWYRRVIVGSIASVFSKNLRLVSVTIITKVTKSSARSWTSNHRGFQPLIQSRWPWPKLTLQGRNEWKGAGIWKTARVTQQGSVLSCSTYESNVKNVTTIVGDVVYYGLPVHVSHPKPHGLLLCNPGLLLSNQDYGLMSAPKC